MELQLGLEAPETGARVDVVVRARDGAGLGEVRAQLLARVRTGGATGPLSVGGAVMDDAVLLGAAPLVQGALLRVGDPVAAPVPAALQVRFVGGADAGRVHPLPPGGAVVGREAGVRLGGDAVSRRHCRLDPGPGGRTVRVVDLDSTNGTSIEGEAVPADGADLHPGHLLGVGAARLEVTAVPGAVPPPRPTGDGHLAVDRPPRLDPPDRVVQVVVPTPPSEHERGPLPLLAVLAPLVLGIGLWRLTGSTSFLLFTLLSPVLVLGAHVTERRTGRRRSRRERALWAAQRAVAEQVLAGAVRADELARRTRWPDLATIVQTATGPGPRLWERGRHGLDLRLGLADQPARVEAEGDLAGLVTTARDVPVVVALADVGVLGVAGDGATALARAALLQAAVLHGPRDLQVVVLTAPSTAGSWGWTRWLPHVVPDGGQDCRALLGLGAAQAAVRVAELTALLDARRAEPPGPARSDHRPVLLVVAGASALREVPGLVRLLADGPAHGVHAVCVEADPALLPAECRATAVVHGDHLVLEVDGSTAVRGTGDLLADDLAERAARALAPLRVARRDRGSADGLPPHVRWTTEVGLHLSGDGEGDGERVLARWATAGRSTSAVLGRGADGVLAVDLVRDGPHALVAGTTGSGKSELLQTLIASLALGNRPDELALVLVDYKGGAAFGPCARLPHVVGTVTDLDGALAERALASLGAELSRRETVLRAAGCKDVEEHRRTARPGEVLPRLVLVVDEFAALAEDLPDFVTGLVGVAQRGRSLGVHLVLATQRPEGVVSADIRANTNLRLCLAVTRDSESRDVLDSPVAAAISRTTPGRAWLRTGHTDLVAFQAARVGGRRPVAGLPAGPVVEVSPVAELGDPLPRPPAPDHRAAGADPAPSTDLALLAAACEAAARRLRVPPGRSPWLPPLPTTVVACDLPRAVDASAAVPGRVAPLAYGLLDDPGRQAQRPLTFDLDAATHLMVVGAARSGRTTVLRGLAGALAARVPPDDVHLYAVDGGGGLAGLAALPHTGAVVGLDQAERVDRLLQHLLRETDRRQALLAAAGLGGLVEQRAAATPAERLPHLLLLLDRWEAFTAAYQDLDGGRLVDVVHHLLREGPAAGLHVVLTADRSGLVGRTASLVPDRLVLRMADPTDLAVAGVPARLVSSALPPGRGWSTTAEPLAVQVTLLDHDPAGPAQAAALATLAARAPAAARPPRRIGVLPTTVHLRDLPPAAHAPGGDGAVRVLLGVGGDELRPVALDLPPALLVAGPPGSGRSTALAVLAHGLGGRLPVVVLAPRPSPLRDLPGCLADPDPTELAEALGDGPSALLVDDAELVVDGPLGPLLERLVRGARDHGSVVVAAGTTAALLTGYRGAVVELRRARSGLLLRPESPGDGDLLGLRLSRAATGTAPPGRGLLVHAGQVTALQVALPG